MHCWDSTVEFLSGVLLSATFNELLYRIIATCFITFGVVGVDFYSPFLPAILLLVLVTISEIIEKWLSIPHSTVVSLSTVLMWAPMSIWKGTLKVSADHLIAPTRIYLLTTYFAPLLVSAYSGALVTLSDIWKVKVDLSILLAVIPTAVEVLCFSVLHLITGAPYTWCLLTALCICGWDASLMRRRATLMERNGIGLRYDVPQLMKSSLVINSIFCMFVFNLMAQMISACTLTYELDSAHNWTMKSTSCSSDAFTSEGASAGSQLLSYLLALTVTVVLSPVLFLLGRHTGAPKTQMLSVITVSSIAAFFQASAPRHTTEGGTNPLHMVHGGEPLACFLVSASLVYGWRKNQRPSTVLDNVRHNVKQARNNIANLLYAVNVALHCYLAYLIFVYCLSTDETFLKPIYDLAPRDSINLGESYLSAFRGDRLKFALIIATTGIVASLLKAATVVGILRWKYKMNLLISTYYGSCSMAKGTIPGVLCCYVLMVRLMRQSVVIPDNVDKPTKLHILSGMQLSHTVNIIIAYVVVNLVVNPLCVLISGIVCRKLFERNRRGSGEVQLRSDL